jgi:hypothetical protein
VERKARKDRKEESRASAYIWQRAQKIVAIEAAAQSMTRVGRMPR